MSIDPKANLTYFAAALPVDLDRRLNELDRVVLDESIDTDRGRLPRGAEGTVVLVWRDGQAFDVEFTKPFPALVALRPHQISRTTRRTKV